MVKHVVAAIALVLLPGVARAELQHYAEPPPEPEPEPIVIVPTPEPKFIVCDLPVPSHDKLGFRITAGTLHLAERNLETFGLSLYIEHPVFRTVRLFAEYELMWFGDKAAMSPATEGYPGTGHRGHAGARAELIGTTVLGAVHFYVDAEVGGGLGVISDDVGGVRVLPHAFAGLRAGYDYLWGHKTAHSSRVWETEVLARAIRFDGGTGAMFGIGMAWGD